MLSALRFRGAALAVALTLALGACAREPAAPPAGSDGGVAASGAPDTGFNSTAVSGLDYGRGLVLKDTQGQPRRLEDFKGSLTLVFFGFANCPDICPTTLMRLAEVRKAMGEQAKSVQVVFVTLDPERDDAAKLAAYVGQFDASFIGLRPEPAQLDEVQKSFRVIAVKMPVPDTDTYMVDHSSVIYVYDRQSVLSLVASPDFEIPKLAADLTKLAAG